MVSVTWLMRARTLVSLLQRYGAGALYLGVCWFWLDALLPNGRTGSVAYMAFERPGRRTDLPAVDTFRAAKGLVWRRSLLPRPTTIYLPSLQKLWTDVRLILIGGGFYHAYGLAATTAPSYAAFRQPPSPTVPCCHLRFLIIRRLLPCTRTPTTTGISCRAYYARVVLLLCAPPRTRVQKEAPGAAFLRICQQTPCVLACRFRAHLAWRGARVLPMPAVRATACYVPYPRALRCAVHHRSAALRSGIFLICALARGVTGCSLPNFVPRIIAGIISQTCRT